MKYQISNWLNHRFYPFVWKQLKPISSWTVSRWTVVPCGCRWSAATRPSHRRRFRPWRHADWAKLSRKNRATIYPSPTVFRRAIRRQLTACRAHDPPRPTFYFIRIRCLGLAATDCPPRPRWRRPGADLRCTPCPKRTTSLPTRRCRLHDADRPLAPLMWRPSTWPKSRKWSVLSSKKKKKKMKFSKFVNKFALKWNVYLSTGAAETGTELLFFIAIAQHATPQSKLPAVPFGIAFRHAIGLPFARQTHGQSQRCPQCHALGIGSWADPSGRI